MRSVLLGLLLTISINVHADYGWRYFFKCKVVTSDTTIVGFIGGPYEYLSDSVLSRFKRENKFFKSKLITDLKNQSSPTVGIFDFVYIHEFSGDNALYESKKSLAVKIDDIKSLSLYDMVAFHYEPHHVISNLTPQDTLWCKREALKRIDDKETDGCCPNTYLIYDDKINYEDVVHMVMAEKKPERREKLLMELRQYKIVALRLCWCG